jgi:hypothetical protein
MLKVSPSKCPFATTVEVGNGERTKEAFTEIMITDHHLNVVSIYAMRCCNIVSGIRWCMVMIALYFQVG